MPAMSLYMWAAIDTVSPVFVKAIAGDVLAWAMVTAGVVVRFTVPEVAWVPVSARPAVS